MRILLQRTTGASVTISGSMQGQIGKGLVLLAGVEAGDTQEDIRWLVQKIVNMRIFADNEGKMNLSLQDVQGELLLVSQFTLHASTKKGNRPGFSRAAAPDTAIPLYEALIAAFRAEGLRTETGVFGADMQVELINDGPVTIWLDSKNKE